MTLFYKKTKNETKSMNMYKAIFEVIELVDVYGWSLKRAKLEAKKRLGLEIKARSKDEFVSALREIYKNSC
ncbi:hypothetical protein Xekk_03836 [Xenorhabdus sp. KK7.4]|nr:hypothetical protein Xekk_03836 [Xenorhabdus sp. KK7.4]